MSREQIVRVLQEHGPLLHCQLRQHIESRLGHGKTMSQSALYRLLAANVVNRVSTPSGYLFNIASDQLAQATLDQVKRTDIVKPITTERDGRIPRPLFVGTIFDDISIDECARAASAYATQHASCVVVVDPDRRCTLYQDGSAQTRRAWAQQFAHMVGTFTALANRSRSARQQRVQDIAEAIQHHIDLEAARTFACGPTRGANAPISTGVPQS